MFNNFSIRFKLRAAFGGLGLDMVDWVGDAYVVDGAYTNALRTLVAPSHRFAAVKGGDPVELLNVVVENHTLLEHPVPMTGDVNSLEFVRFVLDDPIGFDFGADFDAHQATSAICGIRLTPSNR